LERRVIEHLRRLTLLPAAAAQSDGILLERFRRRADPLAFEALVRRHGPMVFGVCRRVLGNHHDAEDAFQATFLVLARKSASVTAATLANWLFVVAYRTAVKAKTRAAKRRAHEQRAAVDILQSSPSPDLWRELPAALDEELNQLADKYRIPFVLCELEGSSQRDAARQLGWPEGTLFVRLMRAKKLLAHRLRKRGFGPAAGMAAFVSANTTAEASATLVAQTVKAATLFAAGKMGVVSTQAVALAEGVLMSLFFSNLKMIACVLLIGLAGAGAILSLTALNAGQQAGPPKAAAPDQAKDSAKQANLAAPANAEVRKAIARRIKALQESADARIREFIVGKTSVSDYVVDAIRLLLAAELDASETDQERKESAQRALALIQPLKEPLDRRFVAGTIGPATYYHLAAQYFDVVSIYERESARAARGRPSVEVAKDVERRAMDDRQVELIAQVEAYRWDKLPADELLKTHRRLVAAELKSCKTAAERIACWRRALDFAHAMAYRPTSASGVPRSFLDYDAEMRREFVKAGGKESESNK
jgi:RNA polymerase sigma factor (sigma-70 family)